MPSEGHHLQVDVRRMEVPADWSGTVDVEVDGRRVFSFDPGRRPAQRGGFRVVSWPPQFRPYLTGRAELTFRGHGAPEPLAVIDVAFDDRPDRVRLIDEDGNPLAADKWGRLSRTFDSLGHDHATLLLDDVEALLHEVRQVLGVPAFVAYGSLLGAVREGGFIGHDTDADVSYLSAAGTVADVALESFRLQRGLLAAGWGVMRASKTYLQVWRGSDAAESRRIDIFTGYYLGDRFATEFTAPAPLPRDVFVPLGTVTLAGRALPAPAQPEALLQHVYGPGWRVPDPAFKFTANRAVRERAHSYFGRPLVREAISVPAELAPPDPAEPLRPRDFARWVHEQAPPDRSFVDVRAGVGHDTTWWAEQGRTVLALDVLENTRSHRCDRPHLADRLVFERLPLSDLRRVLARGALLAAASPEPKVMTADRVLDVLRPGAGEGFWTLARMVLAQGGLLLAEVGPERLDAVRAGVARCGGVLETHTTVTDEEARPAGIRVSAVVPSAV